jgi:hypothetical protein
LLVVQSRSARLQWDDAGLLRIGSKPVLSREMILIIIVVRAACAEFALRTRLKAVQTPFKRSVKPFKAQSTAGHLQGTHKLHGPAVVKICEKRQEFSPSAYRYR